MKIKILVWTDPYWSIGRVNRNVEKLLDPLEYEFTYCNWAVRGCSHVANTIGKYDIILTNLVALVSLKKYTPNLCLTKFIFVCHGSVELKNINSESYPDNTTYSMTSQVVKPLFPEHIRTKIHCTYNGVDPTEFNFVQRSGKIIKIGWCGVPIATKRVNWTNEIATKCELEYEIQSKMTYDEIKQWYNTIDIFLVNAGPDNWVETGPLPPFEAIVSGVLAIGTRVGNFADVPGPKYDTIEEAVTIINDLKNNPEKVLALMKEQYDYVIKNWTYESLIDGWKHTFRESLLLSRS